MNAEAEGINDRGSYKNISGLVKDPGSFGNGIVRKRFTTKETNDGFKLYLSCLFNNVCREGEWVFCVVSHPHLKS